MSEQRTPRYRLAAVNAARCVTRCMLRRPLPASAIAGCARRPSAGHSRRGPMSRGSTSRGRVASQASSAVPRPRNAVSVRDAERRFTLSIPGDQDRSASRSAAWIRRKPWHCPRWTASRGDGRPSTRRQLPRCPRAARAWPVRPRIFRVSSTFSTPITTRWKAGGRPVHKGPNQPLDCRLMDGGS